MSSNAIDGEMYEHWQKKGRRPRPLEVAAGLHAAVVHLGRSLFEHSPIPPTPPAPVATIVYNTVFTHFRHELSHRITLSFAITLTMLTSRIVVF